MCGILGLFRPDGLSSDLLDLVTTRAERLQHRGPDNGSIWADQAAGLAFAHRRLSIFDVSDAGNQPMTSANGRYVLCYNGEIYNFPDLRDWLESSGQQISWRSRSDTEVLLEAISHFGLRAVLERATGMFAFALWDRQKNALHLARDAFGEKPLYYAHSGKQFVFASELKALKDWPEVDCAIDRAAMGLCLRRGYIPAPYSMYKGIKKLEAGAGLTLYLDPNNNALTLKSWKHWDSLEEASKARANRFEGSFDEAVDQLDKLLHASISRQMEADVTLGAFLSGGIDSSTVTAILQAQSSRPIETFSLGFPQERKNEAKYAKEISHHLGTSHNEIYLDESQDIPALIRKMAGIFDEPFLDASQIPTYALAEFARQKVTVSLSGDAGDELFGGYERYSSFAKRQQIGGMEAARTAVKLGMYGLRKRLNSSSNDGRAKLMALLEEKKHRRYERVSPSADYQSEFETLVSTDSLIPGSGHGGDRLVRALEKKQDWSILERISMFDLLDYLGNDILVKLDRSAMAHSLESRIPMLDKSVARFAFSLPDEFKVRDGQSKVVLKAVLSRYVPQDLWDRKKMGFGVPEAEWLAGPLNEMANQLFSSAALKESAIFDPEIAMAIWAEYNRGTKKLSNLTWRVFQIQSYLASD